jgi:hypothetical protein
MTQFLKSLNLVALVVLIAPFFVVGLVFHLACGGFRLADEFVGSWVDSL